MIPTQPEFITWNDSMKTGIASIDEQHQILVNMLNIANDKLTNNSSHRVLNEIVHDLISYALYHFDTEEELMLAHRYPGEAQQLHFQEHRDFSAKVAKIQNDISHGRLVSPQDLLSFLKAWLVNHILGTDKKMAEFLLNTGNGPL